MHEHDEATEALAEAIVAYALERMRLDPPPLDHPRTPAELAAAAGRTVTADGIGPTDALRVFAEVLAPACISVDHPRFLSFVPAAPTEASVLFDLVVGASSIYAGSWLEGAGAVYAENEALRWIADLADLPPGAGGAFVSGGTAGNLSALIAARWRWRHRAGGEFDRTRGLILASSGAHSSIGQAAQAMDADVVVVEADARHRRDGPARPLRRPPRRRPSPVPLGVRTSALRTTPGSGRGSGRTHRPLGAAIASGRRSARSGCRRCRR